MSFGIARRMVAAGLIKRPKDMLGLTGEQFGSLLGSAEVSTENLYAVLLEKAQSLGIRVIGLERLYEIIREETDDGRQNAEE